MIGYLDCSTGVSGDKFLGAVLDIGEATGDFTAEHLQELVSALAPEARVVTERVNSRGVAAVGVRVDAEQASPSRSWGAIQELIAAAPLAERARARALEAFGALALAEARVHGTEPASVHFHEVGALDSILDVLGVCAGLDALGVEQLLASPVAVGGGTVDTSHGVLPVPAPATVALLVGVPTIAGPKRAGSAQGAVLGELTTPTGAALLHACTDGFGAWPALLPQLIGYGAGTRDIGSPNVCRLVLGAPAPFVSLHPETVTLLESNIDHLSPEAASTAVDQLLAEGALDVWSSPIVMKKGRSAFTLSALVPSDDAEHFAERFAALTGTLGIRVREIERLVAEREVQLAHTPYGTIRFKVGAGRMRPEADDVARIARETGRSFGEVERELEGITDSGAEDPR